MFCSCECGNGSVASLQNISECYCCYYYIKMSYKVVKTQRRVILFLKILVVMLSKSVLLNIQELKLYGFRNGVLRLVAGKYKTICRLCRLSAVVSQIRCNNGCMNRWKSGYSKFVSLKPLSQQNPFLSLKVQASSEIIWFEMLYRTDH